MKRNRQTKNLNIKNFKLNIFKAKEILKFIIFIDTLS